LRHTVRGVYPDDALIEDVEQRAALSITFRERSGLGGDFVTQPLDDRPRLLDRTSAAGPRDTCDDGRHGQQTRDDGGGIHSASIAYRRVPGWSLNGAADPSSRLRGGR